MRPASELVCDSVVAMTTAIAQALYLFCPLLVSAALAGVVLHRNWLAFLRQPIDGGATFRGHRIFGDNKTWRMAVTAIFGCVATVAFQSETIGFVPTSLLVLDYRHTSPLCLGFAMGVGAVAGELPNSFVKRQLGIPPGRTTRGFSALIFYVWDQVDLLTGTWPLLLFWFAPSGSLVAASFAMGLVLHPAIAALGYAIGARKTPR